MKSKRLCFAAIIPAFNEAKRIGAVIEEAKKYVPLLIVIDDGSDDKTSQVAEKAGALVLRHRLNLGKGAAMTTGASAAFLLGAEAIIYLDADGQHDPKQIPAFIDELQQGKEIVFGKRDLSNNMPIVRLLGNRFAASLINFCFGIYRPDMLCGFFALTKEAYEKVRWDSARYGVETEIVARTGRSKIKYGEVPVETIYIDKYKGVTIFDALGVLFNIPRWFF